MRETELITICPYCGEEKTGSRLERGCCGESYMHFEQIEVWCDTKEELTKAEKEAQEATEEDFNPEPNSVAKITRESSYGQ